MPYIITTSRGTTTPAYAAIKSRRAVVTLEEARRWTIDHVCDAVTLDSAPRSWGVGGPPEPGGTVGPLPDGTVIEVKAAQWAELSASPMDYLPLSVDHRKAIVDDFNDRQGGHVAP